MKRIFLLIVFINSFQITYAQVDSVMYSNEFVFKDGIYVSIEDFKNNRPNLTEENFKKYNTDIDYLDHNFFENRGVAGIARRKMNYPDSLGNIHVKTIDSLFGYAVNGYLFAIRHFDLGIGFKVVRIFRLGSISYCFEVGANSRSEILPFLKKQKLSYNPALSSTTNNFYDFGFPSKAPQFLIDFQSGKIYDYNIENFEKLIKEIDTKLYSEYTNLSDSKKKKMIFYYMMKVNERNPIYIKT